MIQIRSTSSSDSEPFSSISSLKSSSNKNSLRISNRIFYHAAMQVKQDVDNLESTMSWPSTQTYLDLNSCKQATPNSLFNLLTLVIGASDKVLLYSHNCARTATDRQPQHNQTAQSLERPVFLTRINAISVFDKEFCIIASVSVTKYNSSQHLYAINMERAYHWVKCCKICDLRIYSILLLLLLLTVATCTGTSLRMGTREHLLIGEHLLLERSDLQSRVGWLNRTSRAGICSGSLPFSSSTWITGVLSPLYRVRPDLVVVSR